MPSRLIAASVDHEESAEAVRDLLPIDMERPKESMIRPVQVGVERTTFANRSHATHEAEGESDSRAESESDTDMSTSSSGHTSSSYSNKGSGNVSSHSDGASISVDPTAGAFMPTPDPSGGIIMGPAGSMQSFSAANASSDIANASEGIGDAFSDVFSEGSASTRSTSHAHATHRTRGSSEVAGESEGLEPVFKELPTQLYSLEESLHQAARTMKTLSPGECIVAFGSTTEKVKLPLLPLADLSPAEAQELRRFFNDATAGSIAADDAQQRLETRQKRIIEQAREHCGLNTQTHGNNSVPAPAPAGDPPSNVPVVDDEVQYAKDFWKRQTEKHKAEKTKSKKLKPFKPTIVVDNDPSPSNDQR